MGEERSSFGAVRVMPPFSTPVSSRAVAGAAGTKIAFSILHHWREPERELHFSSVAPDETRERMITGDQ